jgi:hypothetical protein
MSTCTIDWISATEPLYRMYEQLPGALYYATRETDFIRGLPPRGYAYAVTSLAGVVVASGRTVEMGTHFVASGGALRKLADTVRDGAIKRLLTLRVSRLDIALDIDSDVYELAAQPVRDETLHTTARHWSEIISGRGGRTVYIGSRTSERFMRVYDKQAEAGLAQPCTRFELELKGDTAKRCARQLLASNSKAEVICAWLADYAAFDFPAWYEAIGEAMHLPIEHGKRADTDTRKWLMSAVVPSIVRLIREGDATIMWDMQQAIKAEIAEE